jgi:hypothetical protein
MSLALRNDLVYSPSFPSPLYSYLSSPLRVCPDPEHHLSGGERQEGLWCRETTQSVSPAQCGSNRLRLGGVLYVGPEIRRHRSRVGVVVASLVVTGDAVRPTAEFRSLFPLPFSGRLSVTLHGQTVRINKWFVDSHSLPNTTTSAGVSRIDTLHYLLPTFVRISRYTRKKIAHNTVAVWRIFCGGSNSDDILDLSEISCVFRVKSPIVDLVESTVGK